MVVCIEHDHSQHGKTCLAELNEDKHYFRSESCKVSTSSKPPAQLMMTHYPSSPPPKSPNKPCTMSAPTPATASAPPACWNRVMAIPAAGCMGCCMGCCMGSCLGCCLACCCCIGTPRPCIMMGCERLWNPGLTCICLSGPALSGLCGAIPGVSGALWARLKAPGLSDASLRFSCRGGSTLLYTPCFPGLMLRKHIRHRTLFSFLSQQHQLPDNAERLSVTVSTTGRGEVGWTYRSHNPCNEETMATYIWLRYAGPQMGVEPQWLQENTKTWMAERASGRSILRNSEAEILPFTSNMSKHIKQRSYLKFLFHSKTVVSLRERKLLIPILQQTRVATRTHVHTSDLHACLLDCVVARATNGRNSALVTLYFEVEYWVMLFPVGTLACLVHQLKCTTRFCFRVGHTCDIHVTSCAKIVVRLPAKFHLRS